ncbi:DNA-binding response regulator RegX3 [Mycolicibacterium conceptionense]|uniref:DNA-binding response regulator RegX3 n=1 Tax=Mycolicibacterium conceptionense TaxID=451644 RepID=A0A0U1DXY6_9MYCO|nr:DNA-binding response regulator RegX3 [Mycolicibacterium conceptionense]
MQVLLVEDDDGVASALADLLGQTGASVVRVSHGTDALHRVKGADLVLLDLGLPDMDGLDVLRTLRRASSVPVIIMTPGTVTVRWSWACVPALTTIS